MFHVHFALVQLDRSKMSQCRRRKICSRTIRILESHYSRTHSALELLTFDLSSCRMCNSFANSFSLFFCNPNCERCQFVSIKVSLQIIMYSSVPSHSRIHWFCSERMSIAYRSWQKAFQCWSWHCAEHKSKKPTYFHSSTTNGEQWARLPCKFIPNPFRKQFFRSFFCCCRCCCCFYLFYFCFCLCTCTCSNGR